MNDHESKAKARVERVADALLLKVGGTWHLTETLPELDEVLPREAGRCRVRVVPADLVEWDSSLPLFLLRVRSWCQGQDAPLDIEALPGALQRLFRLISDSEARSPLATGRGPEPHRVRRRARELVDGWTGTLRFVGECALGAATLPVEPRHFAWKDFLTEMTEAGPKALPIIGLLSFLIEVTFAFETATQLRQFGAQIYVIAGIGVAVVRQIGPLIAAVVLAGRTGAAFAAHIGNMKLGGEIDALDMLGVSPVKFLVLPRLAALVLMMPFITLYSDLLGILGGLVITTTMLDIPATEFWVRLQSSISLTDVNVGIVKGLVFGILVGLAGTLHGLRSERSSVGVGRAVTSAVVTGIASLIVADALFSPILQNLGL